MEIILLLVLCVCVDNKETLEFECDNNALAQKKTKMVTTTDTLAMIYWLQKYPNWSSRLLTCSVTVYDSMGNGLLAMAISCPIDNIYHLQSHTMTFRFWHKVNVVGDLGTNSCYHTCKGGGGGGAVMDWSSIQIPWRCPNGHFHKIYKLLLANIVHLPFHQSIFNLYYCSIKN